MVRISPSFPAPWVRPWLRSLSSCSCLYGGEGGNSKSRGDRLPRSRQGAMPPRAFASLRSPHEGGSPPSEPPVRIPPARYGGEGGIRTHGAVASTRAFQARRFGHSRTSPHCRDYGKVCHFSMGPSEQQDNPLGSTDLVDANIASVPQDMACLSSPFPSPRPSPSSGGEGVE